MSSRDVALTRPTAVRRMLAELAVRPSRALGQNFLVDANILRILVDAAELSPSDGVVEVGPGLGALTDALLARAGRVLAVEKDARLAAHLADRYAGNARFELLPCDALSVDWARRLGGGLNKVVSNLPYAVGSRVLVDLAGAPRPPDSMVVTVQQEVGARLTARPGEKDYGLLTLLVGYRYRGCAVKRVGPRCFWPPPQVHSSIVRLMRCGGAALSCEEDRLFRELAAVAFRHRRKQLGRVLTRHWRHPRVAEGRALAALEALGIAPEARPETVAVDQWVALAKGLMHG